MGGFGLMIDGQQVVVPEASQRLVALLALACVPLDRRLAASRLWPDKTDDRAAANLRSSLWRLPCMDGAEIITVVSNRLALHDAIDVDVRRVERQGWSLVEHPEQCAADLDRSLLFAELLPAWYDEWLLAERERLAQLQLHFVEALAYEQLRRGAIAEALDNALRLVAIDPLRERSQRVLLTVYCTEGSLGQAQRQLDRYGMLLDEAFGCRPSLSIGRILLEIEERLAAST
ncbi:MAG: BTAD domain-containing putative transcriptional regulator [Ilumatobacteraceae bacterium]